MHQLIFTALLLSLPVFSPPEPLVTQGEVIYGIAHFDAPAKRAAQLTQGNLSAEQQKAYGPMITMTEQQIELQEFQLLFTPTTSLCRQVDRLEPDNTTERLAYQIAQSTTRAEYTFFHDLSKRQKVHQLARSGQLINIQQPPAKIQWKISQEQKQIGKYICTKAIGTIDRLDREGKPATLSITAWFTPEISVPFGPVGIDGLPGLILELATNEQFYYYAKQVRLGPNLFAPEELVGKFGITRPPKPCPHGPVRRERKPPITLAMSNLRSLAPNRAGGGLMIRQFRPHPLVGKFGSNKY